MNLHQNEIDLLASLKYRLSRTDQEGKVALIRDERYVRVILRLIEEALPMQDH